MRNEFSGDGGTSQINLRAIKVDFGFSEKRNWNARENPATKQPHGGYQSISAEDKEMMLLEIPFRRLSTAWLLWWASWWTAGCCNQLAVGSRNSYQSLSTDDRRQYSLSCCSPCSNCNRSIVHTWTLHNNDCSFPLLVARLAIEPLTVFDVFFVCLIKSTIGVL